MKTYEFTLILDREPDLDEIERFGGYFCAGGTAPDAVRDVTFGTAAGVSEASCAVEAATFETAVAMVAAIIRAEGFAVERVEVDREGLALMEAAPAQAG